MVGTRFKSLENLLRYTEDREPISNIACCFSCGWKGSVSDCDLDQEGDWESGYYDIHFCPRCGECIDEYEMTEERAEEWIEWNQRRVRKRKISRKQIFKNDLFIIE
jgi:hypothetical protein